MAENDSGSNVQNNNAGFAEQQARFTQQVGTNNNFGHNEENLAAAYIAYIINSWKMITLAAVIGLAASIAMWFQIKDSVTVSFPVRVLPTYESSRYTALNLSKAGDVLSRDELPIVAIPDVTLGKLLFRFVEKLRDDQSTFNIALSSELFKSKTDAEARASALKDFVINIKVEEPASQEMLDRGRGSRNWAVSFDSQGIKETRDFLENWIGQTTSIIRADLVNEVQQAIEFNKEKSKTLKADLTSERSVLIREYERKLAREIETLKEDAAVARSAGIKSNVLTGAAIGEAGGVLAVQESTERYLRGYVSLEKEIDLLQNRETPEPFASALDVIDQKLDRLENDESIERLQQILDRSPLKQGAFKAVSLEPQFIKISRRHNPKAIFGIGIFLGVILAGIVLSLSFAHKAFLKPGHIKA